MDMSNNSNKKRPPPKTSSRRSSTKKQASLKTGFASVFTQQQDKYNQALSEQYKGKRVLLSSDFVYGRRPIPDGEDDLLFVYNVESVDESTYGDKKPLTAKLRYKGTCIRDGGEDFEDYPNTGPASDDIIEKYRLTLFKDDHELYNKYLGKINKRAKDKEELQCKLKESEKINAADDLSDIDRKIESGEDVVNWYEIMKNEFEPDGELTDHLIQKGPHQGQTKKKQQWCK